MTLGQVHDTLVGHGQQLCEILSRSKMAVKSYDLDTHILLWVHFDLDLGGMTLGQGHDTPVGHDQQLCEIVSRSNMAALTRNLAMCALWPWVKVMTHPWVMDNNCVKYYPEPTWQWRVMTRTHIFCYVCTLTLTLEVWLWVKVMTHPWVMDNNCVKYYPDSTWQWGVMPGHGIWVCVHCDLDLGGMTLGQGHDTSLGHGQ